MRSGKVCHKGVPDCLVERGDGDDDPYSWDVRHNLPGYELHSNGTYYNVTQWETHTAGTGGAVAWLKAEKGDEPHHDWKAATDVCQAIRAHDGSRPALWAAGFIRPHVPLVAPKEDFEALADLEIDLPEAPANATDLPKPSVEFEGESLAGLLTNPRGEVRDALHAMVDWGEVAGRSRRTHEELTIEWTGKATQAQRFDLRTDPGEHVDLVG